MGKDPLHSVPVSEWPLSKPLQDSSSNTVLAMSEISSAFLGFLWCSLEVGSWIQKG